MRTITLEDHFATPRFLNGSGRDLKEQAEKFNNAGRPGSLHSFAILATSA